MAYQFDFNSKKIKPFLASLITSLHYKDDNNNESRSRLSYINPAPNQTAGQLVHTSHRKYEVKNFSNDITIQKDIQNFFEKAKVLYLNPDHSDYKFLKESNVLGDYVRRMLEDMYKDTTLAQGKDVIVNDIMSNIFKEKDVDEEELHEHSHSHSHNHHSLTHQQNVPKNSDNCDYSLIADTLQGYTFLKKSQFRHEHKFKQDWLIIMSYSEQIKQQQIGLTILNRGVKFTETCQKGRILLLIITPKYYDSMHSPVEIGRTFGTLLMDDRFLEMLVSKSPDREVKHLLNIEVFKKERMDRAIIHDRHSQSQSRANSYKNSLTTREKPKTMKDVVKIAMELEPQRNHHHHALDDFPWYHVFRGIYTDILNRLPFYMSDWYGAFFTKNVKTGEFNYRKGSTYRIIDCILFLFISILLPILAFGSSNMLNTCGAMNVERVFLGQSIAGLIFSVLSTQPLGLLMTTPPITLLIKFVYKLSKKLEVDFIHFYSLTGCFIGLNLILFSLFNFSRILKKITPSIEELFAIFTAYAFIHEVVSTDITVGEVWTKQEDKGKLFLWNGLIIVSFMIAILIHNYITKTTYFNRYIRGIIADNSLLFSVVVCTLVYNTSFTDIDFCPFNTRFHNIFETHTDDVHAELDKGFNLQKNCDKPGTSTNGSHTPANASPYAGKEGLEHHEFLENNKKYDAPEHHDVYHKIYEKCKYNQNIDHKTVELLRLEFEDWNTVVTAYGIMVEQSQQTLEFGSYFDLVLKL